MKSGTCLVASLALLVLAAGGCGGPQRSRSTVVPVSAPDDTVELDSKDIVTMAHQMAASIARCPHILKNKKQPVVMVMKAIQNETKTIKYLNRISLAKIRAELYTALPRQKILFVMERDELEDLRAEEGKNGPDAIDYGERRIAPDYVLKGRFLDHPTRRGIYYLCTFQVVHLESGAIVWEDKYEVKRVMR